MSWFIAFSVIILGICARYALGFYMTIVFMRAISCGNIKKAKKCVKFPININGIAGVSPLIIAVEIRRYDIIELLLENGIDMNMRDEEKRETALMKAVYDDNERMVGFLLKNGADINIRNRYGESALMIASKLGYNRVIDTIFQYGEGSKIQPVVPETTIATDKPKRKSIDASTYEVQLINSELSNKSAAAYLGVSTSTLEHMRSQDKQKIRRESIPCYYNATRRIFYHLDALDAYKAKDWALLKEKRQEYKGEWQEVLGNKK